MPVTLRTCVHCNTTFTSAVTLSNHLRAFAQKKNTGLLTGADMFEQNTASLFDTIHLFSPNWCQFR